MVRRKESLVEYSRSLAARFAKQIKSGTVFAKVLTNNDDSGRHGVLIPSEAYEFFPTLTIRDPAENASRAFEAFDAIDSTDVELSYIYYQRYPERRITRVNKLFNDRNSGARLVVVLKALHSDNSTGYYVDGVNESNPSRFRELAALLFGEAGISPAPGTFVLREIEAKAFSSDAVLEELLGKFDQVASMGWIDSLRSGNTGIGYTFETLIGVKENNDKTADFKGIEVKCKHLKGEKSSAGKINLFQEGPTWAQKLSGIDRLKRLGSLTSEGLYQCYSQVSISPNNLGLALKPKALLKKIELQKNAILEGHWPYEKLGARLLEKHSRAVFVKADTKVVKGLERFQYQELVYCESPSILKFLEMVQNKGIVFEFTMSEKPGGKVRNHGYPWRLVREDLLTDLFGLQVKLR